MNDRKPSFEFKLSNWKKLFIDPKIKLIIL